MFVDGCFWHGCPEHRAWPKHNAAWWRAKLEATARRDEDTDARLRAAGWHVVRLWEHVDAGSAAARVKEALAATRDSPSTWRA